MRTVMLEIRHRLRLDGDAYVVIENFGSQPEISWRVPDRTTADALITERKSLLKAMVASISDDARKAVGEALEIDNLQAGHA